MSEQCINIEQLSLQNNEVVEQNRLIVQVVEEACQMVSKLAIQVEEPVEVRVRKLATRLHDGRSKMVGVQLELNLQIAELQLKEQPLTM